MESSKTNGRANTAPFPAERGGPAEIHSRAFARLPIGLAVLRLEDPGDPESWVIVEFNPAGLLLSAAGRENPAGRPLLAFAPELRGADLLSACAEALRQDRDAEVPDFVSRERAPGRRFAIKVFPLGGDLVGLAFEDVTARRAAETALARSNAELVQFAFVASHDLQSPLRKAKAFAEQLKLRLGGGLDETSRDFVERMCRALEGMQSLIDALLKLARVGAHAAAPREVDLEALAAAILDEFKDEIERSGAVVERSALPVVRGDPQQLRQLLQNLIDNALKFTAPGRAPRVRLAGRNLGGGRAELVVEDEGVGFDMRFADRAFQPFQRLHSRKDYPGNGMGLAICRSIVDQLGGTIAVDSFVGRGTRFTIVFPHGGAP